MQIRTENMRKLAEWQPPNTLKADKTLLTVIIALRIVLNARQSGGHHKMRYMMQITETVLFPVIVVFGNNCIF